MRLTKKQRQQVEDFLPLAYHHARVYASGFDRQEARDVFTDAVIYAVRSYDPGRGASMRTHVINCMHWYRRFLMGRSNQERFERRMTPFSVRVNATRIPGREPVDPDAKIDAPVLLSKIDGRSREILEARLQGDTLQEAGDRFGISKERVRQIEERTLTKLRSRYQ